MIFKAIKTKMFSKKMLQIMMKNLFYYQKSYNHKKKNNN